MAPLFGELSPQATERFRHNYTVSLIKMQSHRGHLGKLLFKRMAELGGVQAADQLDPGALHHKTFMGQGEQSPHIQQRGIPHREPEAGEAVSQLGDVLRPAQRGDEPAHLLRVGVRGLVCGKGCSPALRLNTSDPSRLEVKARTCRTWSSTIKPPVMTA